MEKWTVDAHAKPVMMTPMCTAQFPKDEALDMTRIPL